MSPEERKQALAKRPKKVREKKVPDPGLQQAVTTMKDISRQLKAAFGRGLNPAEVARFATRKNPGRLKGLQDRVISQLDRKALDGEQ